MKQLTHTYSLYNGLNHVYVMNIEMPINMVIYTCSTTPQALHLLFCETNNLSIALGEHIRTFRALLYLLQGCNIYNKV